MLKFCLKHYFLEEGDRLIIEEALIQLYSEKEEDIFHLDDPALIELYNKSFKEKSFT
ncbi:hypothetical protein [Bacillus sp. SA1-12]|uniref:hypothetical protein n=1 Tax=Bacillus sp. SA1-12 TaxID=1455638 RepID=UPI000AAEB13D|nr:hypothetical protein [Bacillus sp. SA1-12]